MKVRFHYLFSFIGILVLNAMTSHALSSTQPAHCLLIGDSQTSSSLEGGFARATINDLEDKGIRVTSYSMSSTSARHWHSPLFNPLREDIIAGRMRIYPESAILSSLDAHSSQSLFQQILAHHEQTEHPVDCVIFQLGDNAPRTGEIRHLTRQWNAHRDETSNCFFISPTWSEARHPNNQYRFKTNQRTVEMRREIETELSHDRSHCQHISTTGSGSQIDDSLKVSLEQTNSPYTIDGLHLNRRGGEIWSQAVVQNIQQLMESPIGPVAPTRATQPVVTSPRAPEIAPPSVEVAPPPPRVTEERSPSIPDPARSNLVIGSVEDPQEQVPEAVIEEIVEAPAPETDQYHAFELVCRSNLNMRTSPGANSTLVGKIPCQNNRSHRQRVAVLEQDEQTGWMKVVYEGQVAWVSGNYLRPTDEVLSIPQVPNQTSSSGLLNCRSNLNMRHGPGTSYLVSGQIPCRSNGAPTPIEVLGVDAQSGWLYVNHNGTTSFVHPRYITTENEITNQINNIVSTLQCQHTTRGCPQQTTTPPRRDDCEGCNEPVLSAAGWLPGCQVLQNRTLRDSHQAELNRCFSSIQSVVLRGNPNRATAFRRMYRNLNEAEQRFLAMTLTAMGEIPPSFALEEMQIVMKVVDNRLNHAQSRGRRNVNALDVALQPWQFSMYNHDINLWRTQLRSGANVRHRANAIRAFIGYQNASFRPPGEVDRLYHYHANYVSPNWRVNSRISRPTVNGRGLRQSGTRHIFYRDIAWSFRHNEWSAK
jgi:uncharacterized protein YraI